MMKLSTRGRYGMRLMVDWAQHYAEGPVTLKAMADVKSYQQSIWSS